MFGIRLNQLMNGFGEFGGPENYCYLKFYYGMAGTTYKVDVRNINISSWNETLFLPPENYYACEELPIEWEDIIPAFNQRFRDSTVSRGSFSRQSSYRKLSITKKGIPK